VQPTGVFSRAKGAFPEVHRVHRVCEVIKAATETPRSELAEQPISIVKVNSIDRINAIKPKNETVSIEKVSLIDKVRTIKQKLELTHLSTVHETLEGAAKGFGIELKGNRHQQADTILAAMSTEKVMESSRLVQVDCNDMQTEQESDEIIPSQSEAFTKRIDTGTNVNDASACALQNSSTAEVANLSLNRAYEALLREHEDLKEQHHAISIENDILKTQLKTAAPCYVSLRTLSSQRCDSFNSENKELHQQHSIVQKEQATLKRQASLVSQSTASGGASIKSEMSMLGRFLYGAGDNEEDDFDLLAIQMY
jgi:hypothetical protein